LYQNLQIFHISNFFNCYCSPKSTAVFGNPFFTRLQRKASKSKTACQQQPPVPHSSQQPTSNKFEAFSAQQRRAMYTMKSCLLTLAVALSAPRSTAAFSPSLILGSPHRITTVSECMHTARSLHSPAHMGALPPSLFDQSSFKRLTATCNQQFLSPADGGGSEA